MNIQQPKPESRKYSDLSSDIEKGIIKIPKFQRDFVWSIGETAKLLDSILKGYPIGTFILWRTNERLNCIKNIRNLAIQDTPEGTQVQYVLDGQQRITSLYAGYHVDKFPEYSDIVVNLNADIDTTDEQIVTVKSPESISDNKYVSLSDVLNFNYNKSKELKDKGLGEEEINTIDEYRRAFDSYEFSIVLLKKEDVDSAIEVFTRINTSGKTLTLFEIISAKTYDEKQGFDMELKWGGFIKELKSSKYESISSMNILHLLSLVLSSTKECKRKTILKLDKQEIIEKWESVISALKCSIDYFRTAYRIPVSQILPYDSLLVPFGYFFHKNKEQKPNAEQRKYLEEFFWRMSLSSRYSSATESKLAQDIKRIDLIWEEKRPDYKEIKVDINAKSLIDQPFSTGNSYCKAVLCLLAYQKPKDFQDNDEVILDNSWLKIANSKNYHYFFPKSYLKKENIKNENSLMNITLVSNKLNKQKIGSTSPSEYIENFKKGNENINESLDSHFIGLQKFGIENNDYESFLQARAELIRNELESRIELTHNMPINEDDNEIILAGESGVVEFKSTLCYDIHTKNVNKKLEYAIAKTVAAFLNTRGGDLFIGIDDKQNALGLENDIKTLKKHDVDAFHLKLLSILKQYIGLVDVTKYITITFPIYKDVKICRVRAEKSSEPIFTEFESKQDFFIRYDCSSEPLNREEQSQYEKTHWKNSTQI